jgi:Ca-activated chloride channel homolog
VGRLAARTLTAALAAAALAGSPAAQEPSFRVDVRLVRILTTVKNGGGELIGNLDKRDFEVFDNGVAQELAVFEHHTEQPLSIAVMIDTSASTNIDLRYEIESVSRFLRAFFSEGNPGDQIALFSFNWETTLLAGFTRRVEVLERNLKGLRGDGGTSMYDAITLVGRKLDGREGRHVMVIVTDGGDTTSSKSYHDALEAAQRADAVLYPILVVPIKNDPGRNTGGEHALTTLAEGTGGRVFAPTLGADLDQALRDILRDLRSQYLLGYYPKNVPLSKERFHRLEVKLKRPDLRVSARSGYYGETAEPVKGWRAVP